MRTATKILAIHRRRRQILAALLIATSPAFAVEPNAVEPKIVPIRMLPPLPLTVSEASGSVKLNPFCNPDGKSSIPPVQLVSGDEKPSSVRLKPIGAAIGLQSIDGSHETVVQRPAMTIETVESSGIRLNPLVKSIHHDNPELVETKADPPGMTMPSAPTIQDAPTVGSRIVLVRPEQPVPKSAQPSAKIEAAPIAPPVIIAERELQPIVVEPELTPETLLASPGVVAGPASDADQVLPMEQPVTTEDLHSETTANEVVTKSHSTAPAEFHFGDQYQQPQNKPELHESELNDSEINEPDSIESEPVSFSLTDLQAGTSGPAANAQQAFRPPARTLEVPVDASPMPARSNLPEPIRVSRKVTPIPTHPAPLSPAPELANSNPAKVIQAVPKQPIVAKNEVDPPAEIDSNTIEPIAIAPIKIEPSEPPASGSIELEPIALEPIAMNSGPMDPIAIEPIVIEPIEVERPVSDVHRTDVAQLQPVPITVVQVQPLAATPLPIEPVVIQPQTNGTAIYKDYEPAADPISDNASTQPEPQVFSMRSLPARTVTTPPVLAPLPPIEPVEVAITAPPEPVTIEPEKIEPLTVEPVTIEPEPIELAQPTPPIESTIEQDPEPIVIYRSEPVVAHPVRQPEAIAETQTYRPPVAVKQVPIAVSRSTENVMVDSGPAVQRVQAISVNSRQVSSPKLVFDGQLTPLTMGHAKVRSLRIGDRIEQFDVTDPSVCQVLRSGANQLKLIGIKTGSTQLIVQASAVGDDTVHTRGFEIEVTGASPTMPLAHQSMQLNQSIAQAFPKCRVEVGFEQDHLVISGICDDDDTARQILRMVRKACLVPVRDQIVVE